MLEQSSSINEDTPTLNSEQVQQKDGKYEDHADTEE